jgi:hypothetical protein
LNTIIIINKEDLSEKNASPLKEKVTFSPKKCGQIEEFRKGFFLIA